MKDKGKNFGLTWISYLAEEKDWADGEKPKLLPDTPKEIVDDFDRYWEDYQRRLNAPGPIDK